MKPHAIIIGGGIGGLLAAHALSGQFERISVLERGCYPDLQAEGSLAMRPGAPQSRCLHLLMAAGIKAVDELLLPGWKEQLLSLGGIAFDASADTELRLSTGWLPRSQSGITLYACSRSLLEHVIRLRMTPDSGIGLYTRSEVVQLEHDHASNSVGGVYLRQPGSNRGRLIKADLVVDASGTASRLHRWLAQLAGNAGRRGGNPDGLPVSAGVSEFCISETVVSPGRRQVSCWYHLDPHDAPDWQCLAIAPDPCNDYRSAMMLRAEHDRWGVVLVDPTQVSLPRKHDGFMDIAARFRDGKLSRLLERARPVSPVYRLSPSVNRWRHYESLEAWPNGLIALGDSACALDPYSGLGMSLAARGAHLLKTATADSGSAAVNNRHFQQSLAGQNGEAWEQTTGCDIHGRALREDTVSLQRLYEAAPASQSIAHAILAVQHLLRPRAALASLDLA